ncbi:YwiC-like family protein [Ammonicoccus fulvus]|uniref:YwiC-like family protein n=1 Tax=Ammonicoccus fulvus TaxID=3138240 RepID=A0ABZ3FIL1_9ACTN
MSTTHPVRPAPSRPKKRGKKHGQTGWVPNQHGAWAMLIAPFWLGAILRGQEVGWEWWAIPLFVAWLVGYLAFAAGSLWLKARRKPKFRKPMLVYAGIAGLAGLLALALAGPSLALWGLAYVPLTGATLWLVAHRQERSTLSGALTILAAALMAVTVRYPNPLEALEALGQGPAPGWWLGAICFFYFFGTVPYVKTLIRERGHLAWVVGSVAFHVLATGLAALTAAFGHIAWTWTGFFALTTVRALLVPVLGPLSGRTVTPKAAGFGEIAFTLLLTALVLIGL